MDLGTKIKGLGPKKIKIWTYKLRIWDLEDFGLLKSDARIWFRL